MLDYKQPDERKEFLNKYTWSETDYNMVNKWFYLDSTIYSEQRLKGILNEAKYSKGTKDYLLGPKVMVRILISQIGRGLLVFALVVLMVSVVNPKHPFRLEFRLLISSVVLVAAFIFYLCYFKKPPPDRIVFGLLFYLALILFGIFGAQNHDAMFSLKNLRGNTVKIITLLLLIQGIFSVRGYFVMSQKIRRTNHEFHQTLAKLSPPVPITFM